MIPARAAVEKNIRNVAENEACAKQKIKKNISQTKAAPLSVKQLLAVSVSAGFLSLAFSRFNLGVLAWGGLVPFFITINGKKLRARLWSSFVFGFLFFLGTIYWVGHVSFVGLIVLCLYLSLYFCLFAVMAKNFALRSSLIFVPAIWVGAEFLRSHLLTGFGWSLIGYTQYKNLWLIQIAAFVGVGGVSFLLVMVNVALTQLISKKPKIRWQSSMVWLPIIILIPVYGYGWHALQQKFMDPDIKVSVIQGNIPQKEKWATEYVDSILARYQQLTLAAAKDKPQLIIWPETSVPGYILDEPKIFKNIVSLSKKVNTHLLVGSPRESEKGGIYYNSAFLFAGSGEIKKVHDKIHLVPFGEYIPYKNMFWFLQDSAIGDFSPGEHYTLFSLPNNKQKSVQFAVLICFEDIFPSLVRRFRRGGADFFIVITNEAWFKISAEPIQHLAMSVFRAIETRCWFVRAANTGISGFIDPYGKVRAKVERGNEDIFVSGFKSLTLASD